MQFCFPVIMQDLEDVCYNTKKVGKKALPSSSCFQRESALAKQHDAVVFLLT